MKIKTIRFKKNTEISSEQELIVKNMIVIISLFAAGVIIGSGMAGKGSEAEFFDKLKSVFTVFVNGRAEQKFFQVFINALLIKAGFVFLIFCSGLSCIGMPVSIITPIVNGLGYGVLSGYLISVYKMNGFGYYLLTILPAGVIFMSVLLMASVLSHTMSFEILSVVYEKRQADNTAITNYIKRFMVIFVITILSAVVESMSVKTFAYLFTF